MMGGFLVGCSCELRFTNFKMGLIISSLQRISFVILLAQVDNCNAMDRELHLLGEIQRLMREVAQQKRER